MPFFRKLWRCLFCWNAAPAHIEDMCNADVIVTQACCLWRDGSVGDGNALLAQALRALHAAFPEKPIIAQKELAMAAPEIPYAAVIGGAPGMPINRSTADYNTFTIASAQAAICLPRGWKHAVVITMPYHQIRTAMCMERLGFLPIIAPVPPMHTAYQHPNAAYWSQRGGTWRFLLREFICRLYFLSRGWV